jgi:nitrite reductase/ring-hydroxylating ferredoxin subunit
MPELPALPECVISIGEQLGRGDPVVPTEELFHDRKVFAAEFARIFLRPWTVVDHQSRLDGDGRYFRFEVATRSVVVVRESDQRLHALRNACLHAGYRVCEAEEGTADHLHCVYHDWEYALDGRLTAPEFTRRYDESRYRLARYPMRIDQGLVMVDLTRDNADSTEPPPELPEWLADCAVSGRARYNVGWNWKYVAQYLRQAPEALLGPIGGGPVRRFGPLGFLAGGPEGAALVRIAPKFPEQTDIEVLRLAPPGAAPAEDEAAEEGLRQTGQAIAAAPLAWLGRDFYDWYWPLLA